jgi:Phosphomannomutase
MNYIDKFNEWLNNKYIDEDTKNELRGLDEKEKELRFFQDMEFGTAGLRGIVGAGTNCMNKYTVGKTAQGLANYINENNKIKKVVIAYDSRHGSQLFSDVTAAVLNNAGIETYIFEACRPVPLLSYAVKYLKAGYGVMVTASHNPKEYNGYKIYKEDGGAILSPEDLNITESINNIKSYGDIVGLDLKLKDDSLYHTAPKEVDEEFINKTMAVSDTSKLDMSNFKIVYSPFCGTGYDFMVPSLNNLGFNVICVEEQRYPNPEFPTVPYPNPEVYDAYEYAIKLAKNEDANVIIVSDPDADRLGVAAKDKSEEWKLFTGNQIAVIFANYLLAKKAFETGYILKTIVSTNLINKMADDYNVKVYDSLVGFKYLSDRINKIGTDGFILAFEESMGFAVASYVPDKNAISAGVLISEIACSLANQNKTLWDYLDEIHQKYMYPKEESISHSYVGPEGQLQMKNIINKFRNSQIDSIANLKVETRIDYLNDDTGFEASNIIRYVLEDGSWITIRPSGTEPKIKYYFQAFDKNESDASLKLESLKNFVFEMIDNI